MKQWKPFFVALAYLFSLPFLCVWAIIRAVKYTRVLRLSVSPAVLCSNCHQPAPLVGIWRCQCGFTYRGHLLRPCPICGRVPRVVRCTNCGITIQLT